MVKRACLALGSILLLCLLIATAVRPAVSADDVEIVFSAEGKGGPALVFVHGWSCDRSYWKNRLPEFAKSFTVVTVDLGGHGESGCGRKDWTVEAFGKDVAAVAGIETLRPRSSGNSRP